MDLDQILSVISPAMQSEAMKFGIAFTFAAWLHSGRVKKEIKASFSGLSQAITELGAALREDLNNHSNRIAKVEEGLNDIKERVNTMEGKHV